MARFPDQICGQGCPGAHPRGRGPSQALPEQSCRSLSLQRSSAVDTGAATLSTESTLRATWYRNLSWCSDRVGERLSGSLQPTPMEIQRNRSLDKGERSCLGASPSLHDLHGFQHETRRSSMLDVSGRLQLHSAIDGDSWPASREANSMAVAVRYHHALRAPVSPVRDTWLARSPPLERVMRQAVNRRTDSHLEALRPHTA